LLPFDATCGKCGRHLHACLNCALYDPLNGQRCHAEGTDPGASPSSKNFCDAFIFRESHAASFGESGIDRQSAESRWNELFKDA
jgi:hypothetical protein